MSTLLTALSLIGGLSQPLGVSQYNYREYNGVLTPAFITSQIETTNFDIQLIPENNNQIHITCNSNIVSYWHEQWGIEGRPRMTYREKLESSDIFINNTQVTDLKYISGIECNYSITNFGYGGLYNEDGTIKNNVLELYYDINLSYSLYYTEDENNTFVIKSDNIHCQNLINVNLVAPYYIVQSDQRGRDINSTRNETSQTKFDLTDIIKAWIKQEEESYQAGFDDGKYEGIQEGIQEGINQATAWKTFIMNIFDCVDQALSIEILPNIKLWYIVAIPLVLNVLKFIMSWFR